MKRGKETLPYLLLFALFSPTCMPFFLIVGMYVNEADEGSDSH